LLLFFRKEDLASFLSHPLNFVSSVHPSSGAARQHVILRADRGQRRQKGHHQKAKRQHKGQFASEHPPARLSPPMLIAIEEDTLLSSQPDMSAWATSRRCANKPF
jgi:hypothetical protein